MKLDIVSGCRSGSGRAGALCGVVEVDWEGPEEKLERRSEQCLFVCSSREKEKEKRSGNSNEEWRPAMQWLSLDRSACRLKGAVVVKAACLSTGRVL